MTDNKAQAYDIPKTCKAGVVVNEGPDFHIEVQDVDVPEPGKPHHRDIPNQLLIT
jgi:hypothetical protein